MKVTFAFQFNKMIVDPKITPIPKLHGYLLGAIGPRPIAFASTIDKDRNPNLSPFSFFNSAIAATIASNGELSGHEPSEVASTAGAADEAAAAQATPTSPSTRARFNGGLVASSARRVERSRTAVVIPCFAQR